MLQLAPISEQAIEAKYPSVVTEGMSPEQKAQCQANKAQWKDMKHLVRDRPAVMLSDSPTQFAGISVGIVSDLPPWMSSPNPNWGSPYAAPGISAAPPMAPPPIGGAAGMASVVPAPAGYAPPQQQYAAPAGGAGYAPPGGSYAPPAAAAANYYPPPPQQNPY